MIKGAPYVIMDDILKSIGFYIPHRMIPPFIVKVTLGFSNRKRQDVHLFFVISYISSQPLFSHLPNVTL